MSLDCFLPTSPSLSLLQVRSLCCFYRPNPDISLPIVHSNPCNLIQGSLRLQPTKPPSTVLSSLLGLSRAESLEL